MKEKYKGLDVPETSKGVNYLRAQQLLCISCDKVCDLSNIDNCKGCIFYRDNLEVFTIWFKAKGYKNLVP